MAAPDPTDKVKDTEYSNWLKVTLALYYMKSGLHTFMQNEVDGLHQSLVQKIYGARTVPLPPCTVCEAHHVKRNKYSGVWTFLKQCKSYCDVWLNELLALHTNPKSEKIYWDNSDVASWPFKPWECAKVFMPRGQPPSNVGPVECDAQAMLTILASCKHFHHKLSPQGLGLTHTISAIRNRVTHDGEMKLSDADRMTYIQQIIQLLEDPISLKSIDDCKAAVVNIQKIDNDSLDVSFNLNMEMTGLRSAVNEFRLELGMHEKRTLDTVDTLKEEYEQLREQFTERFADAENRMDSIEKSIKEQTDTAINQEEKHQEMYASIMRMSADVTSHRARLDTFDENGDHIHSRMDSIEKSIQSVKDQTEMALQQQENKYQELHAAVNSFGVRLESPVKRRKETDSLKQLKSQTEDKLDTVRRLKCISTTQTEEAKKMLDGNRSLVIKGNPGEGKTTTALHLINNEMYTDRRVVVHSPSDWKAVDTQWVDIVILEDILGQFDLDQGRLQEWLVYLPTIQEHVDAGKLRVIITTRVDILLKAFPQLGSIKLFSDDFSLTLSSTHLTISEKMNILNRELQRHQRNLNEDEKGKCINNFHGLIGFPQCCSLFAGDINLFNRGPEFFKSPAKLFAENIAKLEDTRFLSLAFLFCNNSRIHEDCLSLETMTESGKHLLMELVARLHISETKAAMTLLRDIYDDFWGLYIVKSRSYYITFSHPTVYEAVGQVLGDRCIETVVKYSNSEYLYQKTYTAKVKDRTLQNIFIPASVYGILAERMVHDVAKESLLRSVVKHSAFKQHQFLLKLKDELNKGEMIRHFFVGASRSWFIYRDYFTDYSNRQHQDLSEGECITFLQLILKSDEDVVILVYSQLLEFLACTHHNNCSGCWQCEEKQKLLELSLYYHYFEIADKLIAMNACYTYTSLCNSARHGDLQRVQTILEALKISQIFSSVCGVAKDALCRAYISGHQDVIEYLLKESITLDSKHVVDVVREGDMNALMMMTEHLKFHNNWNPHLQKCWTQRNHFLHPSLYSYQAILHKVGTDTFSTSVYLAYCNEKFDMVNHLQKNGVIVSMDMLLGVLLYSSQQAIFRLIQTLKDTGTWDSNWCLASVVLQIAYSTQNYDVCDLLIQLGVSLTMKNLPDVIIHRRASLVSVKKAIQHLKDTGSWDPKCYYASKALRKAYNIQMYEVCDLLVQQGISITMKNLPGVILRPLDHVKTAVHRLKDTNSWDPKCDYASETLKYAYSKQKYDVCDLLVLEGVSLKMKNLTSYLIQKYNPSFEFAKKAIQHLKDTANWDPKYDDLSEALENTYRKQLYNVCDLLVQEGVTLTMKNFPGVCQYPSSFMSVKKAIQHLKVTDSWDPKCNDALKALEDAYSQHKYNVCDLLVQEGVSPTMRYFPYEIRTSKAYESVMRTIQHLKDTDHWDPKCCHASKALTNAFALQMYNVSDVLIHEGVSLTMKNLLHIIWKSVDSESVKKAIQHLKDTLNWDPKCYDASNALNTAYEKEKYDVCDMLIQEGVSLTMDNLHQLLIFKSEIEFVKKAIQCLKDTGNWDPECDDAFESLENAYIKHKYCVCDLLVQDGVLPTMKLLLLLTEKCEIEFEYIRKVIQDLKNTDNWHPEYDDASKALENVYRQQKYDVCDLLIQERVLLTMKSLSGVCQYPSSFVSVKKVIQHLKDIDYWYPNCCDASEALGNAYWHQMYDVCDLLVQEGVALTMKNLPGVKCEFKASFESFKKVIEHLKDNSNWNPMSCYAFEALTYAYIEQKYDVCDLLVQEGVSLTMKNLCYLVSCGRGVSTIKYSVRNMIQHLKDNENWDPDCQYASKTLEHTLTYSRYDVFNLLIQAGVSQKMKNFPAITCIMERKRSIYSVNNAIKQLKGIGSWDPKCDDASKALENAYRNNKYDVCDQLVEEGVSLTMKHLPGLCDVPISVKYIMKAVQHLKDTGSWDPKCVHASKALENAYGQHNYNVCDLLLQEGVSQTMKNLPDVVSEFRTSLESVKKTIQHLKDTFNWDPVCDDASKSLENAYSQKKHNVCDLLLQEGVSLTMKNLPGITLGLKTSLDSVKKTIQHLKDIGNWDPKCDDASKSLENAYSQKKHDVCDLLLQEGVSLTMKNLTGVIMGSKTSLRPIKKAIEHLKDNGNWDPKCDYASEALVTAYIKDKKHVCDLLEQEGFSILSEEDSNMEFVPEIDIQLDW